MGNPFKKLNRHERRALTQPIQNALTKAAPRVENRFDWAFLRGHCWRIKRVMNIAVIHEDETENEFEVELCCSACAVNNYRWSDNQYNKVCDAAHGKLILTVPNNINTEAGFIEFVRSL